jgi:RNA polymerase sporulation-specific sigma factor
MVIKMKSDYGSFTDEELLLRMREGEDGITEYLMNKYKNLVRSKAKSMYILGGDRDDLIQEGMIGLFKALQAYDIGRDASFATFADLCVSRQMYSAVQSAGRKKNIPLNTYISLYDSAGRNHEGEEEVLVNVLAAQSELTPEERVIDRENVEQLEKTIERELSALEKQVLDLYLTGMGYQQIAKVLGRDDKSTDNALQRIKAKLKQCL